MSAIAHGSAMKVFSQESDLTWAEVIRKSAVIAAASFIVTVITGLAVQHISSDASLLTTLCRSSNLGSIATDRMLADALLIALLLACTHMGMTALRNQQVRVRGSLAFGLTTASGLAAGCLLVGAHTSDPIAHLVGMSVGALCGALAFAACPPSERSRGMVFEPEMLKSITE